MIRNRYIIRSIFSYTIDVDTTYINMQDARGWTPAYVSLTVQLQNQGRHKFVITTTHTRLIHKISPVYSARQSIEPVF